MSLDTWTRFTPKAERYAQYRPDYAPEVFEAIAAHTKLDSQCAVADVGSGTGMVAAHFVRRPCHVYAIEPNGEMRRMAERRLGPSHSFHSVDGGAEATTLPDDGVDLIAVGQAMHWFDPGPTRREFRRILTPDGSLAILERHSFLLYSALDDDARMHEEMERECGHAFTAENGYGTDPDDRSMPEGQPFEWYFANRDPHRFSFTQQTEFSEEQFLGWLLSISSAPEETHPKYHDFVDALRDTHARLSRDGYMTIPLTTKLWLEQM